MELTNEEAEARAAEEEELQAAICLEREDHEFLMLRWAAGRHRRGPAGEDGLRPSMAAAEFRV
jgi:hypothetical protein